MRRGLPGISPSKQRPGALLPHVAGKLFRHRVVMPGGWKAREPAPAVPPRPGAQNLAFAARQRPMPSAMPATSCSPNVQARRFTVAYHRNRALPQTVKASMGSRPRRRPSPRGSRPVSGVRKTCNVTLAREEETSSF